MLVLFCGLIALAADQQDLTWNVTLDGKPVGQRTLSIKFNQDANGEPWRMLESWTEINGTAIGFPYRFRERLTARADRDPAAFGVVTDAAGQRGQVQARRGPSAWRVTTAAGGREYSREVPANGIDLSTVDFLDPQSKFPLSRFDHARILSAETGDIWEGDVVRLGPSSVTVAGEVVSVDGYEFATGDGKGSLFYTVDGYLVRFTVMALGRTLVGTLTAPPPVHPDDAPVVQPVGGGVEELPL
jgi:hypothetical protein